MKISSFRFHLLGIGIAAVLAACGGGQPVAPQLPTTTRSPAVSSHPRYTIADLGTLGGPNSAGDGVNDRGSVAGPSCRPSCNNTHVFLWKNGAMNDLGSDGYPSSETFENAPINDLDEVSGSVDTGRPDPNGEDFCGFGDNNICLPFLWHKGTFTLLPLPGGNNGAAFQINNRGQIVGQGEAGPADKKCLPPQVYDSVATLWGPKRGQLLKLPSYGRDTQAVAIGINEKGEVVGTSGNCKVSVPLGAIEAILWRNEQPINLGNLGGKIFNIAISINNKSEITGQATTGRHCCHGIPLFHAYLWRNGVMKDLGTLPGDLGSLGNSINDKAQIVGLSETPSSVRGFLWQNGAMYDFNSLIPKHSDINVIETLGINNRGQITGYGFETGTQNIHAFLATPCDEENPDHKGCTDARGSVTPIVLPAHVRALLQRVNNHRFGVWPVK